ADAERALHVAADEGALEDDDRRRPGLDQLQALGMQPRQARRQRDADPHRDETAGNGPQQRPRALPHSPPAYSGARIDPERPHPTSTWPSTMAPTCPPPPSIQRAPRRARHADSLSSSSAAMSMFDDTCCTSS